MKIQCQSCQAKYTIADEKVLGKVVKIRCKKCSATIVINGNEQPSADAGDNNAFDYANQANEQWTVNVADGDQRTMTITEIGNEYRAGVVNDETYCWKDGMADWLPLREIEQIYSAVKSGGGGAQEVSVPPQHQSVPPPAAAPLFSASSSSSSTAPAESPFAATAKTNGNGNGALFGGGVAAAVEQHAPAAARRAGGRAQGADLFGNVEKAGGEDDVMTSAAGAAGAAAAAAPAVDEKLTGQRNENSVLFSLSALTDKPKEPTNRTTATSDGSGLIDIRALSANMDDDAKQKKGDGPRVDDIMNLSGGGAFGAALAAPILAPPPLEPVDLGVVAGPEPQKSNKTLIFAILGGCAFIAVAIVAVAMIMGKSEPEKTAGAAGSASAVVPEPSATLAAAETTTTPPPSGDTPPAPGTGQTTNKAPSGGGGGGKLAAAAPKPADHAGGGAAKAPEPAAPAPAPAPAQPQDLAGAMAKAANKTESAPATGGGGGSTAPFDRGAAQAAIGAVNVQSCKKADGPTGAGHVTITFQNDGTVQSAVIDSGPYPGSAVGGCVAGKYRGAHVPPFGGAPVRVGKSFTIN